MMPAVRLPALFAVALALALPARAESRNDAVRRGAGPSSPSRGGDSRGFSGPDGDGLQAVCDGLSCLCDLVNAVASAPPGPQPVVTAPGAAPCQPPPPPPDPVRALLLFGVQSALAQETILVPRIAAHVDLPLGWGRGALRLGLEHELFGEIVPAEGNVAAHWDALPLSAVHLGWVGRQRHFQTAIVGGLRLLWRPSGVVPGVDVGFDASYEDGPFFAGFGATGMALGGSGMVGADPWVRLGYAVHHLQLGLGWRYVLFQSGGGEGAATASVLTTYSGPELSVALRL